MIKSILFEKPFVFYLLKFFIAYQLFYFIVMGVIGLSVPGGYYIDFVDKYFDIAHWMRRSLLTGSKYFISIFGHKTYIENSFSLRMINGRSVHLVFSCLGFKVMCFWMAFIVACKGGVKKKILWSIIGLSVIWAINILRISLLLLAVNKILSIPFGLDNHTFFNLTAYTLIILMIVIYDRTEKDIKQEQTNE